jgi:hypothetical protein
MAKTVPTRTQGGFKMALKMNQTEWILQIFLTTDRLIVKASCRQKVLEAEAKPSESAT